MSYYISSFPSPRFLLHILISTSIIQATAMYSEDYIQDSLVDALERESSFAPLPQHTDALAPEAFDQFVADAESDPNYPIEQQFLPGSIPIILTPSALTNPTDHELTTSYYSLSDFTQSDYSIPSDISSLSSLNDELYGVHVSIPSPTFPNDPPSIQPQALHPDEAQFDFWTPDLSPNIGISPEDLSTVVKPPTTSVVFTPPPVHVTPAFSNDTSSIQPQALHWHPAEAQFDFWTLDISPNIGISPEDLSIVVKPPTTSVVSTPPPVHVTPAFPNDPPSIQPQALYPAEAQFDFRTSDLSPNIGISPEDLSTAVKPPTTSGNTPPPVHVTPDSEAPAPDKLFKCPICPYCKSETTCMYDWFTLLASRGP